jgi:predicted nucleic acid-binding protein
MIVISDTSPLTALLTIGAADILTKLFTEVVIPVPPCSSYFSSAPLLTSLTPE